MSLEINTNFLETNFLNILILISFLAYGYKLSYGPFLEGRKKGIITYAKKAKNRSLKSLDYCFLAEENLTKAFFYLQSWKGLCCTDKLKLLKSRYKFLKVDILKTHDFIENIFASNETKIFSFSKKHALTILANEILKEFF